jgi:ribulose-5-phosphate 4-epimerase/fuculose-1-phosphate aldolase
MMDKVDVARLELVIANRVLANEGVTDASGHVSVRHPLHSDRFLLSQSRSPELVGEDDILEFGLDGEPIRNEGRALYHERFIHAAVYAARPDVNAVVHAHAEDVLPFTVTNVPFRPVIGSASAIGHRVPVWDIRDRFGDHTNLLVTTLDHGRDLVKTLDDGSVVLMRGHGFTAARRTLIAVVRLCVFLPRNARVLLSAMQLGGPINGLSAGEIDAKISAYESDASGMWRGWEYFAARAGCAVLLARAQRR